MNDDKNQFNKRRKDNKMLRKKRKEAGKKTLTEDNKNAKMPL
jgi:hypothetical protein